MSTAFASAAYGPESTGSHGPRGYGPWSQCGYGYGPPFAVKAAIVKLRVIPRSRSFRPADA